MKKVKEVMSPIHPLLEEGDRLHQAVYVLFKENIRSRGGFQTRPLRGEYP